VYIYIYITPPALTLTTVKAPVGVYACPSPQLAPLLLFITPLITTTLELHELTQVCAKPDVQATVLQHDL